MSDEEKVEFNPWANIIGTRCATCSEVGACARLCPDIVNEILRAGADRIGSSHLLKSAPKDLSSVIDHTLLRPDATKKDIQKLCEEALEYSFASVCINPYWVRLCSSLLRTSKVKVCTVVGFPFGATTSDVKSLETKQAIDDGADEIDMVINIGALKSAEYDFVGRDIKAVVQSVYHNTIVKVILETAYLAREEKIKACEIAKKSGADFVKTSTGFGPSGASVEDIALMRSIVGTAMGVKASGGIRDYETAMKMIQAGASRIGASASIKIISNQKDIKQGY